MDTDIRWKQRFSNYTNALQRLHEAVLLSNQRELTYLEKQGFIQAFEFTFELSWKVLKDFLLFHDQMTPCTVRGTHLKRRLNSVLFKTAIPG